MSLKQMQILDGAVAVKPEPVIDKSAAIRIATSIGWEPKRTWVGLTDEEIQQIFIANSVAVDNGNAYMVAGLRAVNIARAIEAKLKQKNGYAEENT